MQIADWQKLSEEPLYHGYRTLEKWTYALPTGITIGYEIKIEGTPVCVLPLTDQNTIILAKQFRPGPQKVLLELPGGGRETGETSLEAIQRELLEETGFCGEFTHIGTSLADAYSTLVRDNFVATHCRKIQEPQNHVREPIEVVEISLAEFRAQLSRGELTDGITGYLGLDYLNLL